MFNIDTLEAKPKTPIAQLSPASCKKSPNVYQISHPSGDVNHTRSLAPLQRLSGSFVSWAYLQGRPSRRGGRSREPETHGIFAAPERVSLHKICSSTGPACQLILFTQAFLPSGAPNALNSLSPSPSSPALAGGLKHRPTRQSSSASASGEGIESNHSSLKVKAHARAGGGQPGHRSNSGGV